MTMKEDIFHCLQFFDPVGLAAGKASGQ